MKRLVRNGLLVFVILILGFSILFYSSGVARANEDVDAEIEALVIAAAKEAAIAAANRAIYIIPPPQRIVSYEEAFIREVAEALRLVQVAKDEHGAEDSDFPNIAKLREAEKKALWMLAIKAAQDAIDAIPPLPDITEEHRELIEEARRLVIVAMELHGATAFDICYRMDILKAAEEKIGEKPTPTPKPTPKPKPDDRVPTPPTGGLYGAFAIGAMLAVSGFMFARRRKGRH